MVELTAAMAGTKAFPPNVTLEKAVSPKPTSVDMVNTILEALEASKLDRAVFG